MLLEQETNQGQGIARNLAIEKATGEYIAFVDPDDWIELNALETLYNFAKEKDAKIIQFNSKEYYKNAVKENSFARRIKRLYGFNLIKIPQYNWRNFRVKCLTRLEVHVWNYFYKTSFIKENNIEFATGRMNEDQLFSLGALLVADNIYYLNEFLYCYRCREGSAVNSRREEHFCVFDNILQVKNFIIKHNLWNELKEEFERYHMQCLVRNYNRIPLDKISEYEDMCSKSLSPKEFKSFLKQARQGRNFVENLFSIKNKKENGVKYKVVVILGICFSLFKKG